MAQHPNLPQQRTNMRHKTYTHFISAVIIVAALLGIGCKERPENATPMGTIPTIFPDYAEVTDADMNFLDRYMKIVGEDDSQVIEITIEFTKKEEKQDAEELE